jgi:hypothetical protein
MVGSVLCPSKLQMHTDHLGGNAWNWVVESTSFCARKKKLGHAAESGGWVFHDLSRLPSRLPVCSSL